MKIRKNTKPIHTGCFVFLIFSLLYLWGCSTTVQGGDAGEFITVAFSGGRVHPPGYPATVFLMQLAQMLPSGTAAWKASAVAAVLGALALGFMANGIHRWLGDGVVAIATVLCLGLGPLWLRYATIAEVFTSSALTLSMLFWLGVHVYNGLRGWRVGCLLGAIVALGIQFHHTFIFALPIMLFIVWQGSLGKIGWVCVLLMPMLGLFGYLPLLAAKGFWVWGDFHSFNGLIRFFLREEYGTFQITHGEGGASWWGNPLLYLSLLPSDLLYLPIAFIPVGLYALRKDPFGLCIFVAWVFCGVVFLSLFSLPAEGAAAIHTQRFMVAPTVLLLPIVAKGVQFFSLRWLGFAPLLLSGFHLFEIPYKFDLRMENYLHNTCSVLPDDSILFVEGDGMFFGFLYAQNVLGICQQVTPISTKMLTHSWYREKIEYFDPGVNLSTPTDVGLLQSHFGKRPMFSAISYASKHGHRFPPAVPYAGVVMKFVSQLPTPQRVEENLSNKMKDFRFSHLENDFLRTRSSEYWVNEQYGLSWKGLANVYVANGLDDQAQKADLISQRFFAMTPYLD